MRAAATRYFGDLLNREARAASAARMSAQPSTLEKPRAMNSTEPIHISEALERHTAFAEFVAAVRVAAKESEAAVGEAKPALARIAASITGHDNGQALRLRALLVSLYSGGRVCTDLSDVMALDWPLRKDLCAVILAFGHGEFGYDYMKSAFEQAGDVDARWFLAAAPDPRERLREALHFAKAGNTRE